MDKKELRKHMKDLRDSSSYEDKNRFDEAIYRKIINNEFYIKAKVIFIYVSFGSEADTHSIINHALKNNKTICVPKVINKNEGMKAIKINSLEELSSSTLGILEPSNFSNEIQPSEIDLLIMPGLAFDINGGRLGYGAGYYDRFLKLIPDKAHKLGIAYKYQLLDNIPMDEHDMFIDEIITD